MRSTWWAGVVVLFFSMHAFGQAGREDDGRLLMEQSERTYRQGLRDEVYEANMRLDSLDREGRVVLGGREYYIRQTTRYGPTSVEDEVLIWFLAPMRDEGTWFLSIGRGAGDDEQHFKQKDARRPRRLKAGESDDLFYGTDFTYGDLKPEKLALYDYHIVRTEEFEGRQCTMVEALPRVAPGPKGYRKREFLVTEIAEGVSVYLQVKYYNIRGDLWKVQRNSGFTEVDHERFPGIFRPAVTTMEDLRTPHRTTLTYAATRQLNTGVEECRFDPEILAKER